MMQVTNWILIDGSAMRVLLGKDPEVIANRVAFIEKTPRVRIRADHLGVYRWVYDDGTAHEERQWPEFLNWCEGDKGSGPEDEESRAWCDRMLVALGYTLPEKE